MTEGEGEGEDEEIGVAGTGSPEVGDETEDEDQILRDVFSSLSKGKEFVSLNNLLEWDIVLVSK